MPFTPRIAPGSSRSLTAFIDSIEPFIDVGKPPIHITFDMVEAYSDFSQAQDGQTTLAQSLKRVDTLLEPDKLGVDRAVICGHVFHCIPSGSNAGVRAFACSFRNAVPAPTASS